MGPKIKHGHGLALAKKEAFHGMKNLRWLDPRLKHTFSPLYKNISTIFLSSSSKMGMSVT